MSKKAILLLCGGQSAEHQISLLSARNVYNALSKDKYDLTICGIARDGVWHLLPQNALENAENEELVSELSLGKAALLPGTGSLYNLDDGSQSKVFDAVFAVLHGPFGEDGTLQGLLRLLNLPFVGPDVLASATCMDKETTRSILKEAGIPGTEYLCLKGSNVSKSDCDAVLKKLGLPCFVKPANMGSSVGVSKVERPEQLEPALKEAFRFDSKVVVEKSVEGREIECAILGNASPQASLPGEILPAEKHGYYSYDSKYTDEKGAELKIPAELSEAQIELIQNTAVKAYQAMNCEGMARVDVFLTAEDEVLVNEINTIPGFTNISMYPKLWEISGLSNSELVDRLIELAIERHERRKSLSVRR